MAVVLMSVQWRRLPTPHGVYICSCRGWCVVAECSRRDVALLQLMLPASRPGCGAVEQVNLPAVLHCILRAGEEQRPMDRCTGVHDPEQDPLRCWPVHMRWHCWRNRVALHPSGRGLRIRRSGWSLWARDQMIVLRCDARACPSILSCRCWMSTGIQLHELQTTRPKLGTASLMFSRRTIDTPVACSLASYVAAFSCRACQLTGATAQQGAPQLVVTIACGTSQAYQHHAAPSLCTRKPCRRARCRRRRCDAAIGH